MSDFDRIKVMDYKYKITKYLKWSLLAYSLMIWNTSFAEKTQILDEITLAVAPKENHLTIFLE